MGDVICIKCGATIRQCKDKDQTSICKKCAGELVDKMSTEDLLAHAKVGWDALIDEATGYQSIRPKDDLNKRFKEYKKEDN